jgi:VWFA-related protein
MIHRICLVFALSAVSLLAEAPPAGTPPADPPADSSVTFRSDVSLVRVDAQVVDQQNRSITGLRVEDFVLREDGKQLEIRNFVAEKLPVDVLLLLDVSRSMEPHVQRVAAAAHKALSALGEQDRIAIMVFDRATRERMPFRNRRQDAERELKRVVDQEVHGPQRTT